MEEWIKCNIGDVCNTISDTYRGDSDEVVLVNTSDVLDGKCMNHQKSPNKDLKGQFKKTFQRDDILYSEIRPANKRFAYIDFDGTDYIASTKLMVIRHKENIIPQFLYYIITSQAVIEELQMLAESRSGTFPQITFTELANQPIELPPLSEQAKIVRFLKSLDDKIEVNRRINDNLEQQAQALFKSWFVDFEPFRDQPFVESELGMIPEGWKVEKIGSLPISVTDYVANGSFASLKENVKLYQTPEYAYFIRNTDLKSGKFEVYVDRHSYEFLSKSTLYGGEIIISNVGDVGSVHLCPYLDKPMTLGNNIIMLKPNKQYYSFYLYILFKWAYGNDLIMSIKGGSAQPKFNKTDFKSLKIIAPKDIVLEKYHSMISVLFNKMRILEDESRRLAQLRDTLLPRLMSGELSVDGLKGQFAVSPGRCPGSNEHVSNKTAL